MIAHTVETRLEDPEFKAILGCKCYESQDKANKNRLPFILSEEGVKALGSGREGEERGLQTGRAVGAASPQACLSLWTRAYWLLFYF